MCESPWSTSPANTGISTMYGIPQKAITESSDSTARIGGREKA